MTYMNIQEQRLLKAEPYLKPLLGSLLSALSKIPSSISLFRFIVLHLHAFEFCTLNFQLLKVIYNYTGFVRIIQQAKVCGLGTMPR